MIDFADPNYDPIGDFKSFIDFAQKYADHIAQSSKIDQLRFNGLYVQRWLNDYSQEAMDYIELWSKLGLIRQVSRFNYEVMYPKSHGTLC